MQEKSVHIVFQVINFLHSDSAKQYKLLPIDKFLLITLASHKGIKGIFPMQETLANELGITCRHLRTRIRFLEKAALIFVEKLGRKHFYHFTNLPAIPELQFPYEQQTEELQFRSQGNYSSGNRGTTVPHKNKVNNKLRNQRARTKRAPLSPDWLPNEQNMNKANEVANKVGKSPSELITKFKNLQKKKDSTSADWDCDFENFLIDEHVPAMLSTGKLMPKDHPRPTMRDWTAERLAREALEPKEPQQDAQEAQVTETPTLPMKEVLRIYHLRQQGALANEEKTTVDPGSNHGRGNGRC